MPEADGGPVAHRPESLLRNSIEADRAPRESGPSPGEVTVALRPDADQTVCILPESEAILDGRYLERVLVSARLRDSCIDTMKSLAEVVEAKDTATRGHLDRTQRYGMTLAAEIDPQMARRPELAFGFFLHDIGKVGIPERVLCKPSPLTESEWKVMRTHPVIGADIVRPIAFLAGAIDIIMSHHERFDGGGYPFGLTGEQIPKEARIFAVADAFDAMTSDRPYREALEMDEALERIRLASGTQFDPSVVDAFLGLAEDGQIGLLPGRLLSEPASIAV
jgi:HD-GYP domain-containing protein (c-di-GMP phosphodiesterase class II)